MHVSITGLKQTRRQNTNPIQREYRREPCGNAGGSRDDGTRAGPHILQRFHSIQKDHNAIEHVFLTLRGNPRQSPLPAECPTDHSVNRHCNAAWSRSPREYTAARPGGWISTAHAHEEEEGKLVDRARTLAARRQLLVHVPQEQRHQNLPLKRLPANTFASVMRVVSLAGCHA